MTGETNVDTHDADARPPNGGAGHAMGNGAGRSAGRPGAAGVVHTLARETRAAVELIASVRSLVDDDEEMIATAVEGETDLHEAIGSALARCVELQSLSAGLTTSIESMMARRTRFERQAETIRAAIHVAMEATGTRKLELPLGTVSVRPTPPKVEIVNEADIPAKFWRASDPRLDKAALLKALKDTPNIPGATLSNGGETISVRFK